MRRVYSPDIGKTHLLRDIELEMLGRRTEDGEVALNCRLTD